MADRLQDELRKHAGPKSQVLNAGAIVWSIGQEVARAKRDLPKLKPDVVIIYSGLNEEANAGHLQQEGVSLKDAIAQGKHGLFATYLDQPRELKRNSLIVRYIEYLDLFAPAPSSAPVPEYPIVPEIRENFNRTLREFIDLIRQTAPSPCMSSWAVCTTWGRTACCCATRARGQRWPARRACR